MGSFARFFHIALAWWTGVSTLLTAARRASYDELMHGLRREPGKIALRQGGIHLPHAGDIRRGLDADLDAGLADGDAVAVLEVDAGKLVLGSLFRGFAFFATAAFFPVDLSAVHAAEVAQGGLRRAGFEQEVVARDLGVVGKAEVAVSHPSEQEGVMLGEFEGAGAAGGVLDLESDGGGHGEEVPSEQ